MGAWGVTKYARISTVNEKNLNNPLFTNSFSLKHTLYHNTAANNNKAKAGSVKNSNTTLCPTFKWAVGCGSCCRRRRLTGVFPQVNWRSLRRRRWNVFKKPTPSSCIRCNYFWIVFPQHELQVFPHLPTGVNGLFTNESFPVLPGTAVWPIQTAAHFGSFLMFIFLRFKSNKQQTNKQSTRRHQPRVTVQNMRSRKTRFFN